MAVKEPTGGLKKACWKGYTAVGMKMKNGRKVPNCVPANEEREIPLSHRTKHDVSHYRVLNNGRDVSKHDSYEEAIAHAGEHRRRLKSKGYDADKISVHAYVKEEKENYGLPAHSMKHVMQKIKDGHWEVSSGEVKSGQHLSIIDHTKGKKKKMIHVKEESNEPKDREWGTTKLTKRYKKDTPGQCDCDTMKEEAEKQTHLVKVTVSEPSLKSAEPMLKGVRVRATSEGEAIKRAKSHFRKAGYKVHDAYHHSTITTVKKAGQMDEGMTKAINKKMKNTLSAMRGRASLGAPEKGLSWQQNKAKAVKAGRAMAKEEVEQIDETASVSVTVQGAAPANKKYAVTEIHPRKSPRGRTRWKDVSYHSSEEEAKAAADAHAKKNNLHRMKSIVAEELEQIDELSKETLKSYIQKVAADSQKHPQNPSKRPPEKASRSVAGFDKAYQKLAREEVEQISEGPQRDATRAKNKLKDAIAGANYKRTGAPVPNPEPQHKTAQAHNKAIGRSLRKMEEGTRDLTAALAKKIEKKTGGKETAVRNKAGLLVTKKKSKDKFEEAFKLSPRNSLKYREHKHEYEREEQIKNRPSYQGYHTQIHVDGRHYKAGDRMGAGEKGAQDAGRHAANIAKKTGKKVSLHMIHHETGKTLAIADHEDGKWKYRNLSEAAPIQKQPKAGVEKLVSKMNPDTKAKSVNETRNIIREVIKKAVDKQETNKANGKTATGEPAPKIKIDPVIDLGTNNRGIGGT